MRGGGKGAVGENYLDVALSALHQQIPTCAAFPELVWQAESWSDIAGRSYSKFEPDGSQRLWREAVATLEELRRQPPDGAANKSIAAAFPRP